MLCDMTCAEGGGGGEGIDMYKAKLVLCDMTCAERGGGGGKKKTGGIEGEVTRTIS